VKDPQDSPVQGRTRWRRFAALMVPAVAVAGAVIFGMANGAIAASFAVSGQTFKVSASRLEGTGFVQYGGIAAEKGGPAHPVAVSGIANAKLFDLCQSVKVPDLPIVLTINAGGGGNPATAENLVIDMDSLQGDAVFTTIQIGRDASTLEGGPPGAKGEAKSFGQQAEQVVITDLKQVARSTTAGKFSLNGLKLKVNVGADAKECFN
jgi:uncharacterized protein DUF6230